MVGIYYLKLTRAVYAAGSRIHDHYILMSKTKFFVMTSKPVPNMEFIFFHKPNIKGEDKFQYIINHIHTFDPNKHIISAKTEATNYFLQHQEKFQKVLELLNQSN